jgi:hypothetical protein
MPNYGGETALNYQPVEDNVFQPTTAFYARVSFFRWHLTQTSCNRWSAAWRRACSLSFFQCALHVCLSLTPRFSAVQMFRVTVRNCLNSFLLVISACTGLKAGVNEKLDGKL